MAYPLPKITYDPGTGTVTLNFTYPPMKKAGTDELSGVCHDSMTISGKRQRITERMDEFLTLQMDTVQFADLTAWQAFMVFAIQGGQFKYYPDATHTGYDTWDLEDTDWDPKLNFRGIDKFSFKMRKVPGGSAAS